MVGPQSGLMSTRLGLRQVRELLQSVDLVGRKPCLLIAEHRPRSPVLRIATTRSLVQLEGLCRERSDCPARSHSTYATATFVARSALLG